MNPKKCTISVDVREKFIQPTLDYVQTHPVFTELIKMGKGIPIVYTFNTVDEWTSSPCYRVGYVTDIQLVDGKLIATCVIEKESFRDGNWDEVVAIQPRMLTNRDEIVRIVEFVVVYEYQKR